MNFKQFLIESDLPGTIPAQAGINPLLSGLTKLKQGLSKGLYPTGYTGGYSIIQQQFGLASTELDSLMKLRVIEKEQDGWAINPEKVKQFLQTPPVPGKPAQQSYQGWTMPNQLPRYVK